MLKDQPQSYWGQPVETLIPDLRSKVESGPLLSGWNPIPPDFAISWNPNDAAQDAIFRELHDRLTSEAIGAKQLPLPKRGDPIDGRPRMVMVFGDGQLGTTIPPSKLYTRLPKPKPLFLLINTAKTLPLESELDIDRARVNIAAASCNNGVVLETSSLNDSFARALWISMQGNFKIIEGSPDFVFDDVTKRILMHYGAHDVNERRDISDSLRLTWDQWRDSLVHSLMAEAASALGEAGIIKDSVDLVSLVGPEHAESIQQALEKAETGIGESMRSIIDPNLRIMAVTRTGGGKVNLSADPMLGHLIPVAQITENRYVVARPMNGGELLELLNPSVETWENALAYLASIFVRSGLGRTYHEFRKWFNEQIREYGAIDILPSGLALPAYTAIDHYHHHTTDEGETDMSDVEIVEPDPDVVPPYDPPCGTVEGATALLSALFRSETFLNPGPDSSPMNGKIVVVKLPGHGSVVFGENRTLLTEKILAMKLKSPDRI